MSLPSYLDEIINTNYKHKQLEVIKSEIEKMLPPKRKNNPENMTSHNQQSSFRKTITHLIKISVDKHQIMKSIQSNQTQQLPFSKQLEESKRQFKIKKQTSYQEHQQNMSQWRREMMKHIRPDKIVNMEENQQKQKNRTRIKRIMQAHRAKSERAILKIRTSPETIKNKIKLNIKSEQFKRKNQRNLIIIRPTVISENQQSNIQKNVNIHPKKTISRYSKQLIIDNNGSQQSQIVNNEHALQRLASFEALLPFLDAHKARVEQKPERKEKPIKYQLNDGKKNVLSISNKQLNKISKNENRLVPDNISGWDIQD